MPSDRRQLRGTVLVEDRRTERFFRNLLDCLGFDKRKFIFRPAPAGKGDAGVWVGAQYTAEVEILRKKRDQRHLALVAVRDGDNNGFVLEKAGLDSFVKRKPDELIATPVPTWSIETWLLALLGDDTIDETGSQKQEFEKRYPGKAERQALREAAQAWRARTGQVPSVPSLSDGRAEMNRIDPD